jgi:hypothetical protein
MYIDYDPNDRYSDCERISDTNKREKLSIAELACLHGITDEELENNFDEIVSYLISCGDL